MKTCTTCSTPKPLDQFQVRKASHDGLTASCKECLRARDKGRYKKERPKRLMAMKRYSKTERGKASHAASVKKWATTNANRRAANTLLRNAVRAGRVVPWPVCAVPECNTKKVQGHHPDYDRPLEVVWLCSRHHRQCHEEAS